MQFKERHFHYTDFNTAGDYLAYVSLVMGGAWEFQWDLANRDKNLLKHGVTREQIERAFWNDLDAHLLTAKDTESGEQRYFLFCRLDERMFMKVVFALRSVNGQSAIRPISAHQVKERDMWRIIRKKQGTMYAPSHDGVERSRYATV